jgi:hypothetical protein
MTRTTDDAGNCPSPRALGSVRADELMPSEEFRRRMGLGVKAWRQLLARGLPAVAAGKQRFVIGSDALHFFRRMAEKGQQP